MACVLYYQVTSAHFQMVGDILWSYSLLIGEEYQWQGLSHISAIVVHIHNYFSALGFEIFSSFVKPRNEYKIFKIINFRSWSLLIFPSADARYRTSIATQFSASHSPHTF